MHTNYKLKLFCAVTILFFLTCNSFAGTCDTILNVEILNQCLARELAIADKELNDVYGRLRSKLKNGDKDLLKKSQLIWIASRDKDCEFEAASVFGGTAYQSTFITCQIDRTKQRSKQLKIWAKLFGKT